MDFFDLDFELDDRGNRIGLPVAPTACSRPERAVMTGSYCRLGVLILHQVHEAQHEG